MLLTLLGKTMAVLFTLTIASNFRGAVSNDLKLSGITLLSASNGP